MSFYGERRVTIDKTRFHNTDSSLWIMQQRDRIVLDFAPGHISIGCADPLRHTQEQPRKIHRMAAQIDQCPTCTEIQIEKVCRQPAIRLLLCSNCSIM